MGYGDQRRERENEWTAMWKRIVERVESCYLCGLPIEEGEGLCNPPCPDAIHEFGLECWSGRSGEKPIPADNQHTEWPCKVCVTHLCHGCAAPLSDESGTYCGCCKWERRGDERHGFQEEIHALYLVG